jgi:hypothetical protein
MSEDGTSGHACSLNYETKSQVSSLSNHGSGIPARPETGVGRSMRMRLRPERYRKWTYGAEQSPAFSSLLLVDISRSKSRQRLRFHPELRLCPNL